MILVYYFGEVLKLSVRNWYILIPAAVLIWYAIFRLSRRRLYSLAGKFPNLPGQIPVFGYAVRFMNLNPKGCYKHMTEISKEATKNGGVVGLWLGPFFYLMLSDPQDCDIIMKTCLDKPIIYDAMSIVIGNGILLSNGTKWKTHRRTMQPAFGPKMTFNSLHSINDQIITFINTLQKHVGKGSFDIIPYISVFNVDVVCGGIMGVNINAQDNPNSKFIEAFNILHEVVIKRMFNFLLCPDITFNMSSLGGIARKYSVYTKEFTQRIIEQRKGEYIRRKAEDDSMKNELVNKTLGKGENFLDQMIALCEECDNWTDEEFREEVDTIAYTAMGTTTLTIGFALLSIAGNPDIQKKAITELRSVFGNSKRPVEKEDLAKLDYLERVIKETLRLFQLVPIVVRNTNEEIKIKNYTIPKNTGVIVSLWEMHRRKDIWGPNADEFNPDNFLPEIQAKRPANCFAPFSAGPRVCIGQSFAMITIKATLATILREYELSTDMDVNNLDFSYSLTLKSEPGILVKLNKRQ